MGQIKEELARFDTRLVICSCPRLANSSGVDAWIELSLGLAGAARICIDGHSSEHYNPNLEMILAIIDMFERPIQRGESYRRT